MPSRRQPVYTAWPGLDGEDDEQHNASRRKRTLLFPRRQAQCSFTKDVDDENACRWGRPPALVEPRPPDRVQRKLNVEFARVVQILNFPVPQFRGAVVIPAVGAGERPARRGALVSCSRAADGFHVGGVPKVGFFQDEIHQATLDAQDFWDRDTAEEHVELYSQRAKLYRWRDKAWEKRVTGDAMLLLHKSHRTVSFVLRQEKR